MRELRTTCGDAAERFAFTVIGPGDSPQDRSGFERPQTKSGLPTPFSELKHALMSVGPRRTITLVLSRLADFLFDRWYGLDTSRRVGLDALTVSSSGKSHAQPYQPTGILAFRSIVRATAIPRATGFVDYGCGKGRVLIMAAEAGFEPIVGIELAPELSATCRENLRRYLARKRGGPRIEVLDTDAALYQPDSGARVFYFFCPFDEPVMRACVERIAESLRRFPREAWLIYHLPRHRSAVESHPEFELEREIIAGGYECAIYRHRPSAGSTGV